MATVVATTLPRPGGHPRSPNAVRTRRRHTLGGFVKHSIGVSWLLVSLSALAIGCSSKDNNSQPSGSDAGSDSGSDAKADSPSADGGGDAKAPGWSDLGLDNNSIDAIAVDPKASGTIFVANASGGALDAGLYRSKDGGQTWSPLTNGLPASGCHAVAVHPTQNFVMASVGIATYRSLDGGDSWTESNNDPGGVYTLVYDSSQSKGWTVTSQNGIYVSSDGGGTWSNVTSVGLPPLNTVPLGPLASDGSNLYLATGGQGVYASADGGTTFTGPGTGLSGDSINALAASSSNAGVVYALTNADGLYRSDDSAATWSKVTTSSPPRYAAVLIDRLDPKSAYVGLDETQGGPGGLDFTKDDGQSWAPFGPDTVPVSVIDQDPSDGTLYVGTVGQGVWRYGT